MKELEFQTLVRKAVEYEGGYGLKMSNRFLVGVPDLLLHLPGLPTMVMEAKFDRVTSTIKRYALVLTPRQALTLRQMAGAGMLAGAVSLLQAGKMYGVKAVHIQEFEGEASLRLEGLTYNWSDRRHLVEAVVSELRAVARGVRCQERTDASFPPPLSNASRPGASRALRSPLTQRT